MLAFVSGSANVGALLSGRCLQPGDRTSTFNPGVGQRGRTEPSATATWATTISVQANGGSGNWGSAMPVMPTRPGNLGTRTSAAARRLGNVGSGNVGSKNVGIGNNGSSNNVGGGNTGNGNIGFGKHPATANIGFGLTGDNQFRSGGSTPHRKQGLFNSGKCRHLQLRTNNWALWQRRQPQYRLFNTGNHEHRPGKSPVTSTPDRTNAGPNTGNANAGRINSGVANVGIAPGWSNIGDANTGWVAPATSTPARTTPQPVATALFWRRDGGGQLNIDLGADLSQIPITLNADIPVNIPHHRAADQPDLDPGIDLPASPINTTINTQVELAPGVNADVVLTVAGSLGPITFPGTDIDVPQLVGTLGGPTSIPIVLTERSGRAGSRCRLGGPGLLNSTDAPSSGLLNDGAGNSSGFFNSGAGLISGSMNEALQLGLSGSDNKGSSGFQPGRVDLGYGNTSTLDPALSAFVSACSTSGPTSPVFRQRRIRVAWRHNWFAARQGWLVVGHRHQRRHLRDPDQPQRRHRRQRPAQRQPDRAYHHRRVHHPDHPGQLVSPSSLTITVPNLFGPANIPLTLTSQPGRSRCPTSISCPPIRWCPG